MHASDPTIDVSAEASGPRLRGEVQAMARHAAPVVVVDVGLMAMGVADTIMVGRVSATALAAAALGNLYFFNVAIFAIGTSLALDPARRTGGGCAGRRRSHTRGPTGLVLSRGRTRRARGGRRRRAPRPTRC